jgi:poly(3-hydroxybutyrate) depolymerase
LKSLRCCTALLCACMLAVPAFAKEKQKVIQFTFQFAGKARTVFAVIPEKDGPLPLILLLHGSGRDGEIMASLWKDLAGREGFIVAAPNAWNSAGWDSTKDTPEFFPAIIEQIKARHPVDSSRIYLFGHSAGAAYALFLSVIDSNLFAATGVHAGALQANPVGLFDQAERKMPIAIWVGDHDLFFPLDTVRETKRLFDSNGYNVELSVILSHDHNYYAVSDEINQKAWNFFKKTQMPIATPENRP